MINYFFLLAFMLTVLYGVFLHEYISEEYWSYFQRFVDWWWLIVVFFGALGAIFIRLEKRIFGEKIPEEYYIKASAAIGSGKPFKFKVSKARLK